MTLKDRVLKNKFFVSVATLISGSLVAQIISIAVSPIMTRLYTEEQIGEYTLILTVVTMFGTVLCGRYDMALVSEQREKDVYAIIKLCLIITCCLSAVIAFGYSVYLIASDSLQISFIQSMLYTFVLLLFTGLGNILLSYNNRNKDYKLMASVSVIRELGRGSTLIALGLCESGRVGLLISNLASTMLGLGRQAQELKHKRTEIFKVTRQEMASVAKKYCRLPLFSVPAIFANNFSYSVLNIFVNSLFGSIELAYYSMSFRMLGLPLNLIGSNVSRAYFEKAAREYDKNRNFRKVFIQTSLLLAAFAIPMVILLMLFSPFLFEVFFGEGWYQAGVYVRYLAPMFGVRLIVSTLTPSMIICNKQNWELIIQSLFIVSTVVIYCIGRVTVSINYFLILISVFYTVIYGIYYLIMFKLSKPKGAKVEI